MMDFSAQILVGKNRAHLQHLYSPLSLNHYLHHHVIKPFQALQKNAAKSGFNLQPASSYRDFNRQKMIWNQKFSGQKKIHDDDGNPIKIETLTDWQKCKSILRWSALPGGSRHHWGTEIDVFDPNLLPTGKKLQLEPWEYQEKGYFFELSQWLIENLHNFDFYLPFNQLPVDHLLLNPLQFNPLSLKNTEVEKKIGYEPWHISYMPLSEKAQQLFSIEILIDSWWQEEILGETVLKAHMAEIWQDFFL